MNARVPAPPHLARSSSRPRYAGSTASTGTGRIGTARSASRSSASSYSGRLKPNSAPAPGSAVAHTRPPIAPISSRHTNRPIPDPGAAAVDSERKYRVNRRSASSGSMPGPSSRTRTAISPAGSTVTETPTCAPSPAYLPAFEMRFRRTSAMEASSPDTDGNPSGISAVSVIVPHIAFSRVSTLGRMRWSRTGPTSATSAPRSTRARIRRFSTIRCSRSASPATSASSSLRVPSASWSPRASSSCAPP